MKTKVSKLAVELNEEQQEAVHAPIDKPVVVLAGPGSGKTAVIAARYSYLVDSVGVAPKNIIAVTFTTQMAGSLLDRIKQTSSSAYDSQGISTIHAFALRQLKALGIITNQQKAKDWTIRKVIDDYIRITGWDRSSGSVRWWIERSKIEGVSQTDDELAAYFENNVIRLGGTLRDVDRLTACATRVADVLRNDKTWTFPDLVNMLWHAVQDRKILVDMRDRIKYILVDEGQDTSELAVKVLRRIRPDRFFIVGDPDQMLFRFTGASPETNLFQVAKEGYLFKLHKNYRSDRTIVHGANQLIANNYDGKTASFQKKMVAARTNGYPSEISYDHNYGPSEEANWVVRQILDQPLDPGEVFVGARTNAQLAYTELELAKENIPYVVLGTNGFFAVPHVKRILDFFSDDVTIESRDTEWRKYLDPKIMKLATTYSAGPSVVIEKLVEAYLTHHRKRFGLVSSDAGSDDNIADDLATLIDISHRFDTVESFLEFVHATEKAEWRREESGVVVLSTIHKLKGAERDVVFCLGWSEGLLPHNRAMSMQSSEADLPIAMSGSVNDERCAAFVLITRAKKKVFISSLDSYRNVDLEPSRFVDELFGR